MLYSLERNIIIKIIHWRFGCRFTCRGGTWCSWRAWCLAWVAWLCCWGVAAKPNQTEAIRHALAKYRTSNDALLTVYASTVGNQDEQWRIVEIYASPASYEQHHQSEAYKNYRNELKPLLVSQDINSVLDGKFLMNKGGMQFQ